MNKKKETTKKRPVSGIDDTGGTKKHIRQADLPNEISERMHAVTGEVPDPVKPGLDPVDFNDDLINPNKP